MFFVIFLSLAISGRYFNKDVLYSSWNYTRAFWWILFWKLCPHCKSLSTASLAIGENADIVPIQETLNQVLHLLIDFILSWSLAEDTIEVEELSLIFLRF